MAYTKAQLAQALRDSNSAPTDPLLHNDSVSHLLYQLVNGGITSAPVDLTTLETLIQTTIDNQNDLEVLITTLNTLSTNLDSTVSEIDANTNDLEGLTTTLSGLVTQIDTVLDNIDAKTTITNTLIASVITELSDLAAISNLILVGIDGVEPLITTSNTRLLDISNTNVSLLNSVNSLGAQLTSVINNTTTLDGLLNNQISILVDILTSVVGINTNLVNKLDSLAILSTDGNAVLADILSSSGSNGIKLNAIEAAIASNGATLADINISLDNLERLAPTGVVSGTFTLTNVAMLWDLPVTLTNWPSGYEVSITLEATNIGIGESVTLEFIGSVDNGVTYCNATCDNSTILINSNTPVAPNQRSIGLRFDSSTFDRIGLDVVANTGATFIINGSYKLYAR